MTFLIGCPVKYIIVNLNKIVKYYPFKIATTRPDERKAIECPYTKTMRETLMTAGFTIPTGQGKNGRNRQMDIYA